MTTAYCFKNGYALLQQTHAVAAGADIFVLAELPVSSPSHGTLWIEGTATVASVHTNVEGRAKERCCGDGFSRCFARLKRAAQACALH